MAMAADPKAQRYARAVLVLISALWFIWGFGYQTAWAYMSITIDGVVTSSRDVPSAGAPRYVTEYLIKSAQGREQIYTSGPTDASLPRSMPLGTHIRKLPWTFSYERDGQVVHDFPIAFYSTVLAMAGVGAIWAIAQLYLHWRKTKI